MKTKHFLIGFLMLSLIAFSTLVQGASTWEVEEDKLFIYEITSWDEDLAEDVYVNDDIEYMLGEDAEVGAMKAQMITDVDEIDDFNNVVFSILNEICIADYQVLVSLCILKFMSQLQFLIIEFYCFLYFWSRGYRRHDLAI